MKKEPKRKVRYENGRKIVPIPDEAVEIIKQCEQLYEDMYGHKPSSNTLVFWDNFSICKNYSPEAIKIMRNVAELDEAYIYAYYKTGFLPTEDNQDLLSRADKKEIKDAHKEYHRIMNAKYGEDKINIIQFIKVANEGLAKVNELLNRYFTSAFNDFLNRHLRDREDFYNYQITNEIEYLGFCAIRLRKDLKSISILENHIMPEHIYSTARAIFETYLYICNMVQDVHFFEKYIKQIDDGSQTKESHLIDYTNILIKPKQKRSNITIKTLADKSRYKTDVQIYDVFYRATSSFIHTDIMSARNYFHISDPFCELDCCALASFVSITLTTLLLEQFCYVDTVQQQFKTDISHLIKNVKHDLLLVYKFLESDPVNKNELFKLFQTRLEESS